ncbi:Rv3654c family TadE-like protein [Rathayibacter soli]|uniref:Rv3654c family TadE-like protein n=1 Tax=Rathayibacter soli TaxID=3144168 RepID=UPI0027E5581E|nr:Rv3654c family TadE-like protein [Glaciibacter superstes]
MQPADALGRPHIPGAAPGPPRERSAGRSLALDCGRSAGRSVALDCERGSGTILAISVIAAVIALIGMLVPVGVALAIKQQVSGAADAAALAAADTASGLVAGFPCENATRAAALNGTQLARCELDGLIATVAARTGYLGFEIAVEARAGPPGS